jgi:hypothetical protein
MRRFWVTLVIFLGLTVPVFGQVTADDFLPPVQGGPTEVKQPDKVQVKKEVVVAATAQDAVNTAVQENKKDRKADEETGVGVRMVQFPSGLGYVSTGNATYREMDNPTATRIAKRKAYVIAYVQAKKGLAETLGSLSSEGKDIIRQALVNINLPKEEMTNISTTSEEAVKQAVDMMLRGFEVYEVKDATEQRTVWVSIVTTPKTRSRVSRPASNAVEAKDVREGLNQVIREVRTGIVPPVGGRILLVRGTGETAFVGFGSSVIRTSQNSAVQAKLNLEAQKIAAMRAKDSLVGLMQGDQTAWEGSVVEKLRDAVQEFEVRKADDPLAKAEATGVQKLAKAKQEFLARLESQDLYTSVRKGILPPGVQTKTWFDDGHEWAFAMSVYIGSIGKAAEKAAQEMREGDGPKPTKEGNDNSPSGFKDEKDPKIKQPGKTIKPGPTGKVGKDDDR